MALKDVYVSQSCHTVDQRRSRNIVLALKIVKFSVIFAMAISTKTKCSEYLRMCRDLWRVDIARNRVWDRDRCKVFTNPPVFGSPPLAKLQTVATYHHRLSM